MTSGFYPAQEVLPSFGFDFNYQGRWYNGSFIGNENIREANVDTIYDFDSGKNILDKGVWSDAIVKGTREALIQALLAEVDKTDGKKRNVN